MDYKKGTPLTADQTDQPARLVEYIRPDTIDAWPKIDGRWCLELWGDPKTTSRFKTWGHVNGKLSAHFIIVRNGIKLHTDPGFARYSVHMELYNQGWWTHGLDDDPTGKPLYMPGLVTVLDTYSPHAVTRDPRMPANGLNKVAAAIDFIEYPASIDGAVKELLDALPTFDLP
jgi:hypothetical protein